jgi:hypothetical protein
MLQKIKTYLEYGNQFCGIEHTIQFGKDKIYVSLLKKSNNDLDVESVFKEDSIETLTSKINKKQHVFLIINNDQVLTKKVESEHLETVKLVYKAFPSINLEDFYYEVITGQKCHFVSICRKDYVEELISLYKKNSFLIINVSFGNNAISGLLKFIKSNPILTSNSSIAIEKGSIETIEKKEINETITYDIDGLHSNNNELLSTSGALDTVLHNFNPQTNFNHLSQSLKKEYGQSRFFSQFLKIGLVVILIILLINFFAFNHYFNEVNDLQQTSEINQTTNQKIATLSEYIGKSQKRYEDIEKNGSSRSSYYVNAIVQTLPSSITLSELNFQPLIKRIKSEQAIEVNNDIILVSGESTKSILFSNWLADLESISWIQHVDILRYEDNSESDSNFGIKLNISND